MEKNRVTVDANAITVNDPMVGIFRYLLKVRQVAQNNISDTTMMYVHEQDRLNNPGEAFIDYGE